MPMGEQQSNNLMHVLLDTWSDRVFFEGMDYPAGYFAASVLNTSPDEFSEMFALTEPLDQFAQSIGTGNMQSATEQVTAAHTAAEELIEHLWKLEPFAHMDKDTELKFIDLLISQKAIADIADGVLSLAEQVLEYISTLVTTPWGIYSFFCVGVYFESGYLRRVKSRCETAFALAALDCFNSDDFRRDLQPVTEQSLQPFTLFPPRESAYVFARKPQSEHEMVFVSRSRFLRIVDFYTYDLFNGMHHGHAPSYCLHCGRFFLTQSKYRVKYCDGISPENPKYTCRQQGARMHQAEQNKNHPIHRIFKTRTNTLRQQCRRGQISEELKRTALLLAEEYRDHALFDNAYAGGQYAEDMTQDHIFAEATRRLK